MLVSAYNHRQGFGLTLDLLNVSRREFLRLLETDDCDGVDIHAIEDWGHTDSISIEKLFVLRDKYLNEFRSDEELMRSFSHYTGDCSLVLETDFVFLGQDVDDDFSLGKWFVENGHFGLVSKELFEFMDFSAIGVFFEKEILFLQR